jgi:hypothetical protein
LRPGSRKRTEPTRRAAPAGARHWALAAAVAALAVIAYLPALHNPFVYDDYETVVTNPSLVDLSNVEFVFTHNPFRPLVNVSYAVDRAIWGFDPVGFHLTNALLHAVVVVLLFLFIARVLAERQAERAGEIACVVSAIFAVHPLLTEAVGYVSGRSELLCGAWFLGALLLARRALVRKGAEAAAAAAGAAVCGVLAFLSKEVAVALPVVVAAYDWLVFPDTSERRRARVYRLYVPALVAVAALGVFRLSALRAALSDQGGASSFNALTQAIVIWRYVGLAMWPGRQSIMHAVHQVTTIADPLALAAVAAHVVLLALAFRARRREPLILFGLIWFYAALAPSSSIIVLREGMAEHRAYFALAGLGVALAGVLASAHVVTRSRTAFRISGAAVVVVLLLMTFVRHQVWSDPRALWAEATVRAEGMWEPYYALGDTFRGAQQCEAAVPQYEVVVRMRPAHRDAWTNLGICLAQTGKYAEAEAAFKRALDIDPGFARGYTNLAALALT